MIMQLSDQNSRKRVMEKVFGAVVKYRPEVFQKVCILYSYRLDLVNIIKFLSQALGSYEKGRNSDRNIIDMP